MTMNTKTLIELTPHDLASIIAQLWMVKRAPEDTVVEAISKQMTVDVLKLCQQAFDIGVAQGSNDKFRNAGGQSPAS